MPRNIPAPLYLHKAGPATTLCYLIRIVSRDGATIVGMTNLDRDILYDDGNGELLYHAPVGFDPASIYASSNSDVSQTEFESLVPVYDFDLNMISVNAGVFDYADYRVLEVNYEDLTLGHWIVMSGKLGEMRTNDGTVIWGELRSLLDQLKKPVVPLYSVGCRSVFGSTSAEERQPCGFDISTLWLGALITAVDPSDPTRTFTIDVDQAEEGFYVPGMIRFDGGSNQGRQVEIESSVSDGAGGTIISLSFPTPYPMSVADAVSVRQDCSKMARDELKGCKKWFGAEWIHHFNGEPDIPTGDTATLAVPGSGLTSVFGIDVSDLPQEE